jgi:CobQ-like glutamine amidotransferase family enzyme
MRDVVRIVVAFPLLTQAQGDGGNALALAHRLRLRGVASEVVVHDDGPLPACNVLLLGGLDEDGLGELADRLRHSGLLERVGPGCLVLAVNAGYVVLGEQFEDADGHVRPGLGVLPVSFTRGVEVTAPVVAEAGVPGVPTVSAYESHVSLAHPQPHAQPWLVVTSGAAPRPEGVVAGSVIGTFLHGPVLARNPLLADHLLGQVLGAPLAPAAEGWAGEVRRQRSAEDLADPTGWGGLRYGRPHWRQSLRRLTRASAGRRPQR